MESVIEYSHVCSELPIFIYSIKFSMICTEFYVKVQKYEGVLISP